MPTCAKNKNAIGRGNWGVVSHGVLWAMGCCEPREYWRQNKIIYSFSLMSSFSLLITQLLISKRSVNTCLKLVSQNIRFFSSAKVFFYIFCFWRLPKIFSGIPEVGMKRISSVNSLFTRNMNFWKKKIFVLVMWRQPKKVPLGCSEPLKVGCCDTFFFYISYIFSQL